MKYDKNLGRDLAPLSEYLTGADIISANVLADISLKIVEERLKLKYTQKKFAEYMGVSQGMVSKWEGDNYNFSIESLANICDKLGLDLKISMSSPNEKLNNWTIDGYNEGFYNKFNIPKGVA